MLGIFVRLNGGDSSRLTCDLSFILRIICTEYQEMKNFFFCEQQELLNFTEKNSIIPVIVFPPIFALFLY